jgi:hypothetical protein
VDLRRALAVIPLAAPLPRGLRALAGAAALALSVAAVAHAQPAQPDPATLSEAQKVSLTHLKELLAVLNSGDHAAIVFPMKPISTSRTFDLAF